MDQQTIIAEFEERAHAPGVTIRTVCEIAGVTNVTFSRWKLSERNPEPVDAKLSSIAAIDEALRQLEAEQQTEFPRGKTKETLRGLTESKP